MVDIVTGTENPSQEGGATFVAGAKPVNGTATPPPAADPAEGAAPEATPEPKQETTPEGQPKVDNVPSSTGEDGVIVYDETGDPALDFALSFIGSLGIEGTDPAMVAAANGDFSLLEAKLGAMGDKAKGWERYVALGKQAHERQLNEYKETQGKSLAACHQAAGGEAQWNALVQWAGTVASAEEKAALNAMFDAGPIQAAMAARALVAAHAEAKGTTIAPANPAKAASGAAPEAPKALTKQNYAQEVDALYRKMGNAMDGSPEYAEIRRRYFGR